MELGENNYSARDNIDWYTLFARSSWALGSICTVSALCAILWHYSPDGRNSSLFWPVCILIVGLICLKGAYNMFNNIRTIRCYIAAIAHYKTGAVANLEKHIGDEAALVRLTIEFMVNHKYLPSPFFDKRNYIYINSDPYPIDELLDPHCKKDRYPRKPTLIKCHACGGTNRILMGEVAPCQYCGTQLKAPDPYASLRKL
jgi:hypothetical protein